MDQFTTRGTVISEEEWQEETSRTGISVAAIVEEAPTLTTATIAGVAAVVLVAIAAVFLLGVLIDCRQQRLLAKKMGEAKRLKHNRHGRLQQEGDSVCIATHMEEPELSVPPAHVLRDIP